MFSVINLTNVFLFTVIFYTTNITAPVETVVKIEPTDMVNGKWRWPTFWYTYAMCFGKHLIITLIAALVLLMLRFIILM